METHRVWEGNWDGDGAYKAVEFVGEKSENVRITTACAVLSTAFTGRGAEF